ncbi:MULTISPECIES: cholesterol catabolism transcriptional regulator KstR [Rhodococcus]|jgi:AcrR family transcriptional regulator|uniref:HTH-type transcriptional repressor KstR n=2 Tax=Rhodococcus TaxID=1827 RepID=A0A2S2BQK0_9NOCA|nr:MULTISPECIES: cholesterol catabolism transcriptional regulator KstR [Rhodococcus]AWK70838.1 TetR family transcriptional regulator [Rhodococcus oxybenzonivorans]MCQ4117616.1 cholesterol catabolism transcriptional regulator KstR [Rhodococcus sp. FXJ9.536]MDV7241276.1 cholesterol catabolism transcriptional regulator KstR [Rhodococcus oxybenzonivorans]MDV7266191.1 cholesterol catabolism transcriptional regulator KstR [Rhodococcus oxybenzonivorans]MDV7273549.1 cholesterol catabolism transcriptio
MTTSSRSRPTTVAAATLGEDDLSSNAQKERRKRILDATLALASKGGYEAVQMRAVAERADVAVGTLYRYFPSKVHLLVSALAREFERIDSRGKNPPGSNPLERMQLILSQITRAMQRDPLLTEAMTRAFMFADASAAAEVDQVGKLMDRLFARAMTDTEPTEDQLAVARVISDVWLSNLVAWLTRRSSATDVANRLELTVELLLGDGSRRPE